MGHYAKVVSGKVVTVIVAKEDYFQTFVDDSPGEWIKTSYNTRGGIHYDPDTGVPSEEQSKALRKNYAGVGYIYDKERDAFYSEKPYPSWILNEQTCIWEPPIPFPDDGRPYRWDEAAQTWIETESKI